ncbi:MAG: M1 family aminopeptidase [Bacteroidota bacterium]
MFFINPKGDIPDKPQQIWTQGETEWNSRWFPTIDKPNERCTQETYLTVADKYQTISNGTLISSTKNTDGTRTDYWKMDIPHAPYLFMITIGEFAVEKESWENIPLEYYVEHDYRESAKNIFAHTPEMLDFFSKITGVKYPWPKYSQVVVRDFVSGAMENTTTVIFGDFVQKTNRELIDNHNDGIVAHELFHHWFGNYLTCESWSNLTMNEGFANYSEYLWFAHKYGIDAADSHRQNEMLSYFESVNQGGAHPLIHFEVADKEDMFDAHSYNKGGLVLHMLRNYIGDEAFFASLKKYLVDNALAAVEAHDFRLVVEEVTGMDLNWFFNQWFFASGHPQLAISYDFQAGSVALTVEQKQNPDRYPAIFVLPFAVDIYAKDGTVKRHDVVLDQRKQTFTFEVSEEPALVNFDADNILLAEVQEKLSDNAYLFQYENAPKYQDRYDALAALAQSQNPAVKSVFVQALDDPYWRLRQAAIPGLDPSDKNILARLAKMAENDPRSDVRAAALDFLAGSQDQGYADLMKGIIQKEQAYNVISSALTGLALIKDSEAKSLAKKMETEENSEIIAAIGTIYAQTPSVEDLGFYESKWDQISVFPSFEFFENYFQVMKACDDVVVKKSMAKLNSFASNQDKSPWKRYAAIKAMHDMREEYKNRSSSTDDTGTKERSAANAAEITDMIDDIKTNETHKELKMIINSRF